MYGRVALLETYCVLISNPTPVKFVQTRGQMSRSESDVVAIARWPGPDVLLLGRATPFAREERPELLDIATDNDAAARSMYTSAPVPVTAQAHHRVDRQMPVSGHVDLRLHILSAGQSRQIERPRGGAEGIMIHEGSSVVG
jgi:hypothetical protein